MKISPNIRNYPYLAPVLWKIYEKRWSKGQNVDFDFEYDYYPFEFEGKEYTINVSFYHEEWIPTGDKDRWMTQKIISVNFELPDHFFVTCKYLETLPLMTNGSDQFKNYVDPSKFIEHEFTINTKTPEDDTTAILTHLALMIDADKRREW